MGKEKQKPVDDFSDIALHEQNVQKQMTVAEAETKVAESKNTLADEHNKVEKEANAKMLNIYQSSIATLEKGKTLGTDNKKVEGALAAQRGSYAKYVGLLGKFLVASEPERKKMLDELIFWEKESKKATQNLINVANEHGDTKVAAYAREVLGDIERFEKEIMPVLIKLYVLDAPEKNMFISSKLAENYYNEILLPKMLLMEKASEEMVAQFIRKLDEQAEVARQNAQLLLEGEGVHIREGTIALTNMYYTSAQRGSEEKDIRERLKEYNTPCVV